MSDTPAASSRSVITASYLLIAAGLLLIMWQGLLPGLLCVCIGFLGTRWLVRAFEVGMRRRRKISANDPAWSPAPPLPRVTAATLVMLAPIGLLILGFSEAREFVRKYRDQAWEPITPSP